MIVGWLEDRIEIPGGAEHDSEALRAATDHEIVWMNPGQVEEGCDLYVVANCTTYGPADLHGLTAPIVKVLNDSWLYGDGLFRHELLKRAHRFVFRSPLHQERFPWEVNPDRAYLLPSPVDLARFRAARGTVKRERRAVWVAHLFSPPREWGFKAAQKWCAAKDIPLDAYGVNTPGGPVDYEDMPEIMASHEVYIQANGPPLFDSFGRAIVEAWAAGCTLQLHGDFGARWWLDNDPDALEDPAPRFWEQVEGMVGSCLVSV